MTESSISKDDLSLIRNDLYVKYAESDVPVVLTQDLNVLTEINEKVERGELNLCKVSNYFNSKNLDKNDEHDGSNTLILSQLIDIKKSKKEAFPIAIKIFREVDLAKDNSNLVEVEIYENFIRKILKDKMSPNFIAPVGHVVCKTTILELLKLMKSDQEKYRLAEGLQIMIGTDLLKFDDVEYKVLQNLIQLTNQNNLHFMIMEAPLNSKKYHDFLISKPNESDIIVTVFQILYSLEVLNRLGIRHNDLHFKNIFLETRSSKKYYDYQVAGKHYYIPIKYIVKIFDWDRATSPKHGIKNTLLQSHLCSDYGQCNTENKKFDTLKFLCTFRKYLDPISPLNYNFIEKVVSIDLLTLLSEIKHENTSYCFPFNKGKDIEVVEEENGSDMWCLPTAKMLEIDIFDQFTKKPKPSLIEDSFVLPES